MFKFEYFRLMLIKAYQETDNDMSFEEVEEIFEYYFDVYEESFGRPHTNIRLETISKILKRLPYCEHSDGYSFDLDVEDYKILIDQHFNTRYTNCDYSINHFMSGDIRANRFYESIY